LYSQEVFGTQKNLYCTEVSYGVGWKDISPPFAPGGKGGGSGKGQVRRAKLYTYATGRQGRQSHRTDPEKRAKRYCRGILFNACRFAGAMKYGFIRDASIDAVRRNRTFHGSRTHEIANISSNRNQDRNNSQSDSTQEERHIRSNCRTTRRGNVSRNRNERPAAGQTRRPGI
jgi:hypothetical protein